MADTATLQTRLLEAELARHKLLTGTATVTVEQGDMKQTYNQASVSRLDAYIAEIKSQLVDAGALDESAIKRRGPIFVAM